MKISQSEFNTVLRGYQIIDCIVRSKVALHFVGRNIEEGAKVGVMSEWKETKRAVSFFTDESYGKGLGTIWKILKLHIVVLANYLMVWVRLFLFHLPVRYFREEGDIEAWNSRSQKAKTGLCAALFAECA